MKKLLVKVEFYWSYSIGTIAFKKLQMFNDYTKNNYIALKSI